MEVAGDGESSDEDSESNDEDSDDNAEGEWKVEYIYQDKQFGNVFRLRVRELELERFR